MKSLQESILGSQSELTQSIDDEMLFDWFEKKFTDIKRNRPIACYAQDVRNDRIYYNIWYDSYNNTLTVERPRQSRLSLAMWKVDKEDLVKMNKILQLDPGDKTHFVVEISGNKYLDLRVIQYRTSYRWQGFEKKVNFEFVIKSDNKLDKLVLINSELVKESILDIAGTQNQTENEIQKDKIKNWLFDNIYNFNGVMGNRNRENYKQFFKINDDLTIDWISKSELMLKEEITVPKWIKFNSVPNLALNLRNIDFESTGNSLPKSVCQLDLIGLYPLKNWNFEWTDEPVNERLSNTTIFTIRNGAPGKFDNCSLTINTHNRFKNHPCDSIRLDGFYELSIFEGLKIIAPKNERFIIDLPRENNYIRKYNKDDDSIILNSHPRINKEDERTLNKWLKGFPKWTEISIGYFTCIRRMSDGSWRLCNIWDCLKEWENSLK